MVMGNHDAALAGKLSLDCFNDHASSIITWTRSHVGSSAARFLSSLPLTLDGGSFRCVHGDFAEPAAFNYVIDPADAAPSWQAVDTPMLFVGHTHKPAIFVIGNSGTTHELPPQDFVIEEGKRFLVSVGSVGNPRDRDIRATYCLFDTEAGTVCWRRIPFDIDAYEAALVAAQLPSEGSAFLRYDPRQAIPPLREQLSFAPIEGPARAGAGMVQVETIDSLRTSLGRWKRTSMAAVASGLLLLGAGFVVSRQSTRDPLVLNDYLSADIAALPAGSDRSLLPVPSAGVAANQPIPGYSVVLADRNVQSVAYDPVTGFMISSSDSAQPVELSSPAVRVRNGMRFKVQGSFRKSSSFQGTVTLVVSLVVTNEDGTETVRDQFFVKEPVENTRDSWAYVRKTLSLPSRTSRLTCRVRGLFAGQVTIRDLSLFRIR